MFSCKFYEILPYSIKHLQTDVSVFSDCRTVLRPESCPTDTFPKKDPRLILPQQTLPRRKFPRLETSPTGHIPTKTISKLDISGFFPLGYNFDKLGLIYRTHKADLDLHPTSVIYIWYKAVICDTTGMQIKILGK